MGNSSSTSSQVNKTETTTQNIADSLNTTISKVLNLTDTGNVNITQPSNTTLFLLLPVLIGGFIVLVISLKKG